MVDSRCARERVGLALPVLLALLACAQGGANDNQRGVGNEPGGVKLGIGDIAVAPRGGYVLFKGGEQLAVGWPLKSQVLPLPVRSPTRLAFSTARPVVYVGSTAAGDDLLALDVVERKELWKTAIPDASTQRMRLVVSPDDRYLVLGAGFELQVFDTRDGRLASSHSLPQALVDVDVLPDSSRALVTTQHVWQGSADTPDTEIVMIELASGNERRIHVPNCSDDVVITPDGSRALLAPTTCRRDPVSVIELASGSERFERNLPGFGPVAMAPDGRTAVAFLDGAQIDAALFDDPAKIPDAGEARYQLMIIDAQTLGYEFEPVGEELPRYAMTPDGQVLLVDSTWFADEPVRLFDTATRQFRRLSGPAVALDNFALSSDSRHAYVLQAGVFDVDVTRAIVSSLPVPFVPENINIAADDRSLYLRRDEHRVCVFDLADQTCTNELRFEVVVTL